MDPWRLRRVTVTVKMGGFLQEKPTYPTWVKENQQLKSAFKKGIMLVPWRVVLQPLDRFFFHFSNHKKLLDFLLVYAPGFTIKAFNIFLVVSCALILLFIQGVHMCVRANVGLHKSIYFCADANAELYTPRRYMLWF